MSPSKPGLWSRLSWHLKVLAARNRFFFVLDILALVALPYVALLIRMDLPTFLGRFINGLILYTLIGLVTRLILFYYFGLYRRHWRYASVEDLVQVVKVMVVATVAIFVIFFSVRRLVTFDFPRSVLLIDAMLVAGYAAGSRFSVRLLADRRRRHHKNASHTRILVAGAGDAGTMIVREIEHNPDLGMRVVGFLDDNPVKHNLRIHGLPVLGGREALAEVVEQYGVDQVIIAMPTASGKAIREIVQQCERVGVKVKTIPGIYELLDGTIRFSQVRDVALEDLLRREPVQTDIAGVRQLLHGRRVLVTGAGGSIGSELCRQIIRCEPAELVLVGHGENSVFSVYHELHRLAGPAAVIKPVIADIRMPERIRSVFREHKPQIVFHAAAHKHVALMELNPAEAITNNIVGTRNVLDAATASGVERFVMISTDKAVNPTGVMGASKRAAELLVHRAAAQTGRPFVAVRFGNVLGSRGSVVPIFERQIAQGGPVTITDPEMKRFFMTIPEAVQLVLQAGVLGQGGEVFVLDMGEPVKIVDMARDLIELSGLTVGQDIEIVFTGAKPGEKLFEELFVPGEKYDRTRHEKIFIAANASHFVPTELETAVAMLAVAAQRDDRVAIIRGLQQLIPEYHPAPDALPRAERQPARTTWYPAENGVVLTLTGNGS